MSSWPRPGQRTDRHGSRRERGYATQAERFQKQRRLQHLKAKLARVTADRDVGRIHWAVNPAYTSVWGDQHWRRPYKNVTRHEAAATVIGRRAQGFKARRREGVTRTRPEDRVVRATDQAGAVSQRAITASRPTGKRGTKSRPPGADTRMAGRATVTPATTGRDDQQRQ